MVRSGFVLLRDLTLYHRVTLSGKVCQLRQLSSPVFMPVKSAVSPPAGQNKPLPIEDTKAKAVADIQTTPINDRLTHSARHAQQRYRERY